MSNLLKLSAAIGLAVVAAAMNYFWLLQVKSPPKFVSVARDIEKGEEITEDDLVAVPIPGDKLERLRETFVPYSQRAVLYGFKAPHDFTKGDVILYRDIRPPEAVPRHMRLGPYRLVSVGSHFAASVDSEDGDGYGGGDRSVTIAVQRPYSEQSHLLVKIIENIQGKVRSEEVGPFDDLHITTVVLDSPQTTRSDADGGESGNAGNDNARSEDWLTIPLDSVEVVPQVLRKGDRITFLVPERGLIGLVDFELGGQPTDAPPVNMIGD